jgi:hypothetical protein
MPTSELFHNFPPLISPGLIVISVTMFWGVSPFSHPEPLLQQLQHHINTKLSHVHTLSKLRNLHSHLQYHNTIPLLLTHLIPCHPLINLNPNRSTLHLFYRVWHAVLRCRASLPWTPRGAIFQHWRIILMLSLQWFIDCRMNIIVPCVEPTPM